MPEVLNLVGLAHKMSSKPEELSGGEQQRVSIARAVVNHPPLLICDEPTGNLDPDTSVGIMQLLHRINTAGTTILMVTHDREMVDKMRKRVIALDHGQARCATSGAGGTRPNDPVQARPLRGVPLDRRQPLDLDRGDDDRAHRDVPARALRSRSARWVVSWSDHVKSQLEVKVYFVDGVTRQAGQLRRRYLGQDPRIKRVPVRLQGRGAEADAEEVPAS